MSLDLKNAGIVDPDDVSDLKSAYDTIDEVQSYMTKELGIPALVEPAFQAPDMSELATRADDLSNAELASAIAQFNAWASFIDSKFAIISSAWKIAERNRKSIDSKVSIELYAKGIPKTEVPDHVRIDPIFAQFEMEELKLYCMKKIIEARYKSLSKAAEIISRLITNRQEEMERSRVTENVKHRAPGKQASPRRHGFRK